MGITYNPFSLEGKTILVTGASSGIGKETAIVCSRLGARLIITGRDAERLNVTTRTVRNLIECGKLKAYKIMKDYRIEEKDLQEFIEKSKIDNA